MSSNTIANRAIRVYGHIWLFAEYCGLNNLDCEAGLYSYTWTIATIIYMMSNENTITAWHTYGYLSTGVFIYSGLYSSTSSINIGGSYWDFATWWQDTNPEYQSSIQVKSITQQYQYHSAGNHKMDIHIY